MNPALISTDGTVADMALSGGDLFLLVSGFTERFEQYTTSGVPVNIPLVPDLLNAPRSLLVLPGSAAAPDASSTWTLLLLGLTAMASVKHTMRRAWPGAIRRGASPVESLGQRVGEGLLAVLIDSAFPNSWLT